MLLQIFISEACSYLQNQEVQDFVNSHTNTATNSFSQITWTESLELQPVCQLAKMHFCGTQKCTYTEISYLTDRLKLLVFLIIAAKQETPIATSSLALPQICTNHTQIHCVPHTFQIILFQLYRKGEKRKQRTNQER